MTEHLERVTAILQSFELTPMMWSDMYFRLGSKTGDYYDLAAEVPENIIKQIPESMSLVYWDYYHSNMADYDVLMKKHNKLKKPVIFAGGAWTFNGIAPNYAKSFENTQAALKAAETNQLEEILCTIWLDDGAETPLETAWPVLHMFAEHTMPLEGHCFSLEQQFNRLSVNSWQDMLLLDAFDRVPGVDSANQSSSSPSKFLLWQDVFIGLYDKHTEHLHLGQHYHSLHQQLERIQPKNELLSFYEQLAHVLSLKADLGKAICRAYRAEHYAEMAQLIAQCAACKQHFYTLRDRHRTIWLQTNKSFGWEVLEIRYGALLARFDTVIYQLEQWLADGTPIDILEEDKLPVVTPEQLTSGNLGRNLFQHIISPSKLSDV